MCLTLPPPQSTIGCSVSGMEKEVFLRSWNFLVSYGSPVKRLS